MCRSPEALKGHSRNSMDPHPAHACRSLPSRMRRQDVPSWMCFRIRTVTRVITKSNSIPGDLQHNDIVEGPCTKGSMCPSIVLCFKEYV